MKSNLIRNARFRFDNCQISRHIRRRTPDCDEEKAEELARHGSGYRDKQFLAHVERCKYCQDERRMHETLISLMEDVKQLPPLTKQDRATAVRQKAQIGATIALAVSLVCTFWAGRGLQGHIANPYLAGFFECLGYFVITVCILRSVHMIGAKVFEAFGTRIAWKVFRRIVGNVLIAMIISGFVGWMMHPPSLVALGGGTPISNGLPFLRNTLLVGSALGVIGYIFTSAFRGCRARNMPELLREQHRYYRQRRERVERMIGKGWLFAMPLCLMAGYNFKPFSSEMQSFIKMNFAAMLLFLAYIAWVKIGWRFFCAIWRFCWSEIVYAILINSSYIIMPRVASSLHERLGLQRRAAEEGTAVGAAFCHEGTTLYLTILAIWINGFQFSLIFYLALICLLSAFALGTPHSGFFAGILMVWLCSLIHPTSALAMHHVWGLFAADLIMARMRTTVNVFSQYALCCHWNGKPPTGNMVSGKVDEEDRERGIQTLGTSVPA